MAYAKYISENTVENAPKIIFESDDYIANPTDEMLLERGYKPLVVDTEPEVGENEYLEPRYTDEGDHIEQHWVVKEYEEFVEEGE